jgi:adenine deaminase
MPGWRDANTLDIPTWIGSIEPGKLAGLIVLDGNPLDDIQNSSIVRHTMVNGRLYDALTMNELGNYDRPRTRFYRELPNDHGIDWNETFQGEDSWRFSGYPVHDH